MINVKKWLAALLTAAMVISGSGFASLAAYAAEETPVGGWKIGTTQYSSLTLAYAGAKDGDTIVPSESLKESNEDLTVGSATTPWYSTDHYTSVTPPKKVVIDTTGINYTGKIKLDGAFEDCAVVKLEHFNYNNWNWVTDATYGPFCIGEEKGVYSIGDHELIEGNDAVIFGWVDMENLNVSVTEQCKNCGLKFRGYADTVTVDPAVTDCMEEREVTYTAKWTNSWGTLYTGTKTLTVPARNTHTYAYVADSLEWVLENGKVKKDADGNPVATAQVTCAYGDVEEPISVTPSIVKKVVDVEATCMHFGEEYYTFEIPLAQLPADRGNTDPIKIAATLNYETEKIDHIAGEPIRYEFLYKNAQGEDAWTTQINQADVSDNGTVTYRVAYHCIRHSQTGHGSNYGTGGYIYGPTLTKTAKWISKKYPSSNPHNYCYRVYYVFDPDSFTWDYYDGDVVRHGSKTMRFGEQVDAWGTTGYSPEYRYYFGDVTNANTDGLMTFTENNHYAGEGGSYSILDQPGCGWPGRITFTCPICGRANNTNNTDPMVAPTGAHTYKKGADGNDVIEEKPATCTTEGYKYKICTACQNHVGNVVDDSAKTGVRASHIVETIPATGHNWQLINTADVAWSSAGQNMRTTNPNARFDPKAKVTATATVACANEGITAAHVTVTYYSWAYDAKVDTVAPDDTHVYDAIKLDSASTDCSAYDKLTYTIKDLKDQNGKEATITVTSTEFGKHTNKIDLTWNELDYKTAQISIVCTNPKCLEIDPATGKHPIYTKQCVVTSAFNDDGSVKRTAACEGYDLTTLKNNPVDVFDLSEAVVTTNKVLPSQVVYSNLPHDEEMAKYIGLSVKVNGVELDQDIYSFGFQDLGNGKAAVVIEKNPDTKEKRPIFGKKASKAVTVKEFGEFNENDFVTKIDGLKEGQRGYAKEFVYDGTEHVVTYTPNTANAKDATVKFAIMDKDFSMHPDWVPEDDEFIYDSFAEKDMIFCDIWVMVTKDGYLNYKAPIVDNFKIGDITVYVYIDNLTVKQGETPAPKYFIGDANHKPISVDEATLGIGIYTAAGDPLTGLAPGTYAMKALSDLPSVIVITKNGDAQLGDPVLTVLADEAGANKEAAEKVAAMIDALSAASTPEEIQAAIDAFNALPDAAKALVPADKAAQLASYAIDTLNDNSTPDQIKAVLNIYNALPDAAKTQVPADKVTKLNAAAEKAGLLQKDSSIKITNKAKAKVKRGKALKVTYKKTGDGKVTVKISGNKKVKKFFKVKGNSIKVAKKAKKGKYKVKVTVSIAATTAYKAAKATKTIKVTVK